MGREPRWYSVAVEHYSDGGWRPYVEPWMLASDEEPDEVAKRAVDDHDLEVVDHPWTVGVFDGYNRFDQLLAERQRPGT